MALVYQASLLCFSILFLYVAADGIPTRGFIQQKYNVTFDKPYDLNLSSRYSFKDGVHKMFVYKTDKPFKKGSPTAPRTEIRVEGLDYTTGVWQFEGDFYVPSPSTGMCIMQVFGGQTHATALMLHVTDGNLVRYGGSQPKSIVKASIYNKWIHLNVIHNADAKQLQIWFDGNLVHVEPNESYKKHYFKFGVYTQSGASERMESQWKNVTVWKRA